MHVDAGVASHTHSTHPDALMELSAEDFERMEMEMGRGGGGGGGGGTAGLPSHRVETLQSMKLHRDIRRYDPPKRKVTVHRQVWGKVKGFFYQIVSVGGKFSKIKIKIKKVPRCAELKSYKKTANAP